MGEKNNKSDLPTPSSSRQASDPAALFTDKADLSNRTIEGVKLTSASVKQGFFSGTIFRDCVLENCDFSRSDFIGAVFEGVQFVGCDFSIADFRSVVFARCEFHDCDFEEGSIKSSIFDHCDIVRCKFFQQTFDENKLKNCTLSSCDFHRSTMSLDEFVNTAFQDTDLADCGSLYHIFANCRFQGSRLNAEAIGLTFGLTHADIDSVGLMWLGQKIERHAADPQQIVADLVTTYVDRGWALPAAVLRLNFGQDHRLVALDRIFAIIEANAASPLPIKTDEIRFVTRIVERLTAIGELPFLAIARGVDAVIRASALRSGGDQAPLGALYHALKDAEYATLESLDHTWRELSAFPADVPVNVAFVFREAPSCSVEEWLRVIHARRHLAGPAPRLLSVRKGSHIETFSMVLGTLGSAVVALDMLERIMDGLIRVRARFLVLTGKNIPPAYRSRALQPMHGPQAPLAKEIQGWLDDPGNAEVRQLAKDTQDIGEHLEAIDVIAEDGADNPS